MNKLFEEKKLFGNFYFIRSNINIFNIILQVLKYPMIDDYRHAIDELDERQYLSICITMHEIRNRYSTLHDIVTKNFDKIKKPRSSNTDSLY